jgi:uncharacterized protein YbaP (TraB family)
MRFPTSRGPGRAKRVAAVALACLGLLAPAGAAPGHPVKPLLWKIEGPEIAQASYLFGTMHLGSEALVTLHPAAEKAFAASTKVHTEVPLDAASQVAAAGVMMRDDARNLTAVVGEVLADRLELELKAVNPELDTAPFEPLKTWVVAYTLPFLPEQMAGIKPLDLVLWERAVEAGKKTAGMQEVKDQITGFNELTEDEQTRFLGTTLDYLAKNRREGVDPLKEAVEIYLTGDPEKVDAVGAKWMLDMAGGEDNPLAKKLRKRLLDERDAIMADYIAGVLEKDPQGIHFFAAGAAHYTGKTGVPARLEEKGYKITRIER